MAGAWLQAVGGRTLTGHEAFSANVRAPNGALSAVPVVLADGGRLELLNCWSALLPKQPASTLKWSLYRGGKLATPLWDTHLGMRIRNLQSPTIHSVTLL